MFVVRGRFHRCFCGLQIFLFTGCCEFFCFLPLRVWLVLVSDINGFKVYCEYRWNPNFVPPSVYHLLYVRSLLGRYVTGFILLPILHRFSVYLLMVILLSFALMLLAQWSFHYAFIKISLVWFRYIQSHPTLILRWKHDSFGERRSTYFSISMGPALFIILSLLLFSNSCHQLWDYMMNTTDPPISGYYRSYHHSMCSHDIFPVVITASYSCIVTLQNKTIISEIFICSSVWAT